MKFKSNLLLIVSALLITKNAVANEVFIGKINAIPNDVKQQMIGKTWQAACPVPLDDLAYL